MTPIEERRLEERHKKIRAMFPPDHPYWKGYADVLTKVTEPTGGVMRISTQDLIAATTRLCKLTGRKISLGHDVTSWQLYIKEDRGERHLSRRGNTAKELYYQIFLAENVLREISELKGHRIP